MLPALLLSIILAFLLSEASPTDPAEGILNGERDQKVQHSSKATIDARYRELRHKFGLDRPAFYFSISSSSQPDTLYKVLQSSHRKTLARLADTYGDWNEISKYYSSLNVLENAIDYLKEKHPYNDSLRSLNESLSGLYQSYKKENILYFINNLSEQSASFSSLQMQILSCKKSFEEVEKKRNDFIKYIPSFHFYGFNNRFNHWLVSLCKGDFGESFSERRPVISILKEAIPWTILLNGIAILIAFLISIPTGVFMAIKKNTFYDRFISVLLFILYSLPVFWIATLLIIFLCGGDYQNLFPRSGVSDLPSSTPFLQKLPDILWHLVLPVFCLGYGSYAFISRQMRSAMNASFSQEYIRTARAKGLDNSTITWKHAFRNALLPMITLTATILPALISGSVVVESIFSYPGIGQKSFIAVQTQDYPVIFALLIITALLTMTGNLIADILYAASNPRISFTEQKKFE